MKNSEKHEVISLIVEIHLVTLQIHIHTHIYIYIAYSQFLFECPCILYECETILIFI